MKELWSRWGGSPVPGEVLEDTHAKSKCVFLTTRAGGGSYRESWRAGAAGFLGEEGVTQCTAWPWPHLLQVSFPAAATSEQGSLPKGTQGPLPIISMSLGRPKLTVWNADKEDLFQLC